MRGAMEWLKFSLALEDRIFKQFHEKLVNQISSVTSSTLLLVGHFLQHKKQSNEHPQSQELCRNEGC